MEAPLGDVPKAQEARTCVREDRRKGAVQAVLGVKRIRDAAPPSAPTLPGMAQPPPKRLREATRMDVSACVAYLPKILSNTEAAKAIDRLRNEVTTTQGRVQVYGKVLNEPRLTAYHVRRRWADPRLADRPYVYSGKTIVDAANFTPVLEYLCCRVEDVLGKGRGTYTAVLVNEYRDGGDHISWHSDDERSIDRSDIASLSLGATRDFRLRDKTDHSRQVSFALGSGDLVHMRDACQDLYQHQVPKRARVAGTRFNLTFRRLADHSAS